MRLLFFLNELRHGAGMINREVSFAEQLVKKGHDVSILSYFKPSWKLENEKIRVSYCLPVKYSRYLYEIPLLYPFFALVVMLQLLRLRPEVVFVDLHQEAFWATLFRPLFRYKVLFTYHGVADARFFPEKEAAELRRIEQKSLKYLKKADLVIAVSDHLIQWLNQRGITAHKIFNGVDCSHFNGEKIVRTSRTVGKQLLFIGRYSEYKGALNVVKAFALVKKKVRDAELIMHAFPDSEAYMDEIKNTIEKYSLKESCHLFGPLGWSEMPYRMNGCTLFVNGSLDETFGMPLLEAQACGKPCVAFRAGGVPEVVADKSTGLLVEENQIQQFAEAIVTLLKDKKMRERFSKNALLHAKRYQYTLLAEELDSLLKNRLNGNR